MPELKPDPPPKDKDYYPQVISGTAWAVRLLSLFKNLDADVRRKWKRHTLICRPRNGVGKNNTTPGF